MVEREAEDTREKSILLSNEAVCIIYMYESLVNGKQATTVLYEKCSLTTAQRNKTHMPIITPLISYSDEFTAEGCTILKVDPLLVPCCES